MPDQSDKENRSFNKKPGTIKTILGKKQIDKKLKIGFSFVDGNVNGKKELEINKSTIRYRHT